VSSEQFKPYEVFREAARILKPGGLLLVLYSNRMFPGKAVKVWKESVEK
jgi:SAM-dependent methyltransferase